ncbi:MAG: ABC transporter substrate-binding protein [Deltaproteobacteria bacterium CG07_land_8_20_14_0_80_60_11]|nr:MAG: ABC transporter substrate-binding protein [Deltaproteobacteria bacterium CG07_land_8_20_14_0_80_60_11]
MTMVRKILVLGMAITLLTAGLAYGAEPIKIGSVLRLSVGAEHGIPSQRGVEMAVAEVNKAGGINGRQVVVSFEDEKDSPAASVNAVQKLINVDKVVALVGPMTSGGMMAAGKIANDAKVVEISPTATTPKLSGYGDYLYRGCSRIDKQAQVLTDYVAKTWKPQTVAIFFSNEPYGKGCADLFTKFFEKHGIKVVATESFMRGSRDFKAQLTKIKGANPDILFIPGYTPETAPAAAQARQLGMKQKILGVYGDMDPVYIQLAGPDAEGHLIGGEYDEEYNTPKNQAFKKAYFDLAKKNNDPVNIMFAALHYDATSMLLEGMKKDGPTAAGIKKYLDNLKDFDGVTGKLSFNKEHDVVRAGTEGVYLLEVKGGKYVKVQ